MSISLVNIRREGKEKLLFEASPIVYVPLHVPGLSNKTIAPGESLTIKSETSKWKIRDGWTPGRYTVEARVDDLSVDDGRCRLFVMTEPAEVELK